MKRYFMILLVMLLVQACMSTGEQESVDNQMVIEETPSEKDVPVGIFEILNQSYLYAEPSLTSSKLINKKATQVLGETHYLSIDTSCKVIITEINEDWCKVLVWEPEWLRNSHIGWVKKNVVNLPSKNSKKEMNLEKMDYKILSSKKHGTITTYRVLVPWTQVDENKLHALAQSIKKKISPARPCNIALYDSKDIVSLIEKYPLERHEYVKLADHFVFELYSDNSYSYYPLVDVQYKEYGGTKSIQ